jgi:hypothetical protein
MAVFKRISKGVSQIELEKLFNEQVKYINGE